MTDGDIMERVSAALQELRSFCTASYDISEKRRVLEDINRLVNRHPSPRLKQEQADIENAIRELEARYPDDPTIRAFRAQLLTDLAEICQILRGSVKNREERIPRPVRDHIEGEGTRRPWQFQIYKDGRAISGRELLNVGIKAQIPVLVRTRGSGISVPRETANWIRQNPDRARAAGLTFEENLD